MKKQFWELKQKANNPEILEMFVYGDVQGDGYDWWSGETIESETSANYFRHELETYSNVKEINIFINSYGGSVFEGTAIYNQLKRHSAFKTVYVDGFACSVAATIAMAGDKVIMPANTMMMIHNAWNYAMGNAKELRKAADDLDVIMEGNRQAYLLKSNGKITEDQLMEMLDGETWLTAKQCIEYGFADEIPSQNADMTKAQELLQKVNQSMTSKVNYNKAIAAQLREMVNAKDDDDPEPEPQAKDPEIPNVENRLQSLFKSLYNK